MAAQIWYEDDADLSVLNGKKVAIVGYGSQGHAHALNLRDSGVDVIVGLRPESKSVQFAKEQGLEVKSVADAAKEADIIMFLAPDQYQAKIYHDEVEPNMKPDTALAFAHGFNIHYGYIKPGPSHMVFMVAPKGPGHIVRREYAAGRGVPVVVAVEQDPRGDGWDITLAYAKALGALRAGAIKTTFTEETETDLFGEQDVLMGGVNHLVETGFEVLTEAGYQPEIAYFEVCHELKMLVDLMNEGGLNKARWSCSDTAQYGDFTSTVVDESTKDRMRHQLQRIQDGSFAKEFMDDQAAGAPHFKELQEKFSHEKIEEVGPKLRAMFSWNNGPAADKDEEESFTGKIAREQVQGE
ncbi:ketol-acid reductoisomerase [Bifidobacterium bombi]|uniref:Ketol-acid reductoisomerase (NADP(+)) n=1 Tax=Bifidobacterium bombi DSM 19703 TaxID=1341695 RepID=A0A080N6M7_9BIFI|nr:ketol-acid reductoisomerase [Bifidobacterium bombi]KFF31754.1 ketol-acid reductoisomerase [Bifidobacterium bombi DSM 19703]